MTKSCRCTILTLTPFTWALTLTLALAACASGSNTDDGPGGDPGADPGGGTDTSAPAIVSQPTSRSVPAGASASFGVTATGGGTLAYQWYRDSAPIAGATGATCTLAAVTEADAGAYHVVVTGTYGTVTSAAATLTVTTSGDAAADAWDLEDGSNPADLAATTGFTASLTLTSTAAGLQGVTSSGPTTLVVGAADGGVTPITLDGARVVTLTETAGELSVASDLPDGAYLDLVLAGTFARTVKVTSAERIGITLSDVTLAPTAGPALYVPSAVRTFVRLVGASTATDPASYTVDTSAKAALHGAGPLLFGGDGALTVTGNKKHAVYGAAHVRIAGGALRLLANAGNAIHTVKAFVMDGGSLTIDAAVGKGVKVDGAEDPTAPLGFIAVNGGAIDVRSYDKAMTAAWECLEDGNLACDAADPDPFVTVNGGTITIETFGTPCDTSDPHGATCTTDLSPEGIESKSDLTVNGGVIEVVTTDDALNAGAGIFVTGGRIYARASANDAIDSNGVMTLSGGVIVAEGTVVPEGGLDADSGTGSHRFTVAGGTFVGTGGTNTTPSVASQDCVRTTGGTPGNTVAVRDETAGAVVFAFQLPADLSAQALQGLLLGSPGFVTGHRYSLYKAASVSCTMFHGLCTGDLTAGALGTASATFTMSAGVNAR
jgi:hypothetical protein